MGLYVFRKPYLTHLTDVSPLKMISLFAIMCTQFGSSDRETIGLLLTFQPKTGYKDQHFSHFDELLIAKQA